jgi:hypothetical protein
VVCFERLSRLMPIFILILLAAWGSSLQGAYALGDTAVSAASPNAIASPTFENQLETEHFILRWTNNSSHTEDNIGDPDIVRETAKYFETAWDKLTGLFGRKPYLPPGVNKIGIVFKDLDCYAYADPPEAPIELNSVVWMSRPTVRQSTSAHELFHKLQYAYGYKTRWAPRRPLLWFSEGTAAWAEVFVWGRVSRDCKLEDMFMDPNLALYDAEDMALPFWIHFISGNRGTPQDKLMVRFFEACEQTGDVHEALSRVIRAAYGSVDHFFLRFALARKTNFWQPAAPKGSSYTRILGPEGKDLVAKIKEYQSVKRGLALGQETHHDSGSDAISRF